jgi:hypothetical protein
MGEYEIPTEGILPKYDLFNAKQGRIPRKIAHHAGKLVKKYHLPAQNLE